MRLSSAGFRTRQCYFASFVGSRIFNSADFAPVDGPGTFVIDGLTSLTIPAAQSLTRFQLEMLGFVFPLTGPAPAVEETVETIRNAWQVDLIGVEG